MRGVLVLPVHREPGGLKGGAFRPHLCPVQVCGSPGGFESETSGSWLAAAVPRSAWTGAA